IEVLAITRSRAFPASCLPGVRDETVGRAIAVPAVRRAGAAGVLVRGGSVVGPRPGTTGLVARVYGRCAKPGRSLALMGQKGPWHQASLAVPPFRNVRPCAIRPGRGNRDQCDKQRGERATTDHGQLLCL